VLQAHRVPDAGSAGLDGIREGRMKGFDDFWDWLDDLGAAFDRLIGWVLVLVVISGIIVLAVAASRLAGGG
jgi:hypothetical protein